MNKDRSFGKDVLIAVLGGLFTLGAAIIAGSLSPDIFISVAENITNITPTPETVIIEKLITITPLPTESPQIVEIETTREIEVTRIVTEVVEIPVIITATPAPEDTPTPTPILREYSLDLTSYSIGDIPNAETEQAVNLVVREQGEKCIGGLTDAGTLSTSLFALTGRLNVNLRGAWINSNQKISLLSDDGNAVEISFESLAVYTFGWYLNYGNKSVVLRDLIWETDGINRLRLEIDTDARSAKLFVNNNFLETVEIESGTVFERLTISNISQQDCLYELNARIVQE